MKWNIKFDCIVDGSDLIDVIVGAISSDRIIVKHREIKEVKEGTDGRHRRVHVELPMRELLLKEMQKNHPRAMTYAEISAFVQSKGQNKNSASGRLNEMMRAGVVLNSGNEYQLTPRGVAASSIPTSLFKK